MTTLFLVNPYAGGGRCLAAWRQVAPIAEAHFPGARTVYTSRAGEESTVAADVRREGGVDLLVTVGGDGTFHGVVNGLLGEGLPPFRAGFAVAPLPLGTGGDFARGLGYPAEPAAALDMLVAARRTYVDVGKITFGGERPGRVRYWVNQSYVGLGAKVVDRVNRAPRWRGGHSYVFSSLLEAMRAHPLEVELDGDGAVKVPTRLVNMIVANGRYSGKGMLTSPSSNPSDGSFEVITIDPMSRLKLLRGLQKFRDGSYLQLPGVKQWRARSLLIEGKGELVEADGEIVGNLPARYEILPRALQILAPP